MRRTLLFALAFAVFVIVGAQAAWAVTCTWTGADSGDWSDGGNWSGNATDCEAAGGPISGSKLSFPSGASNLSTTNDITADTAFTITIAGDGYTLAGNEIDISGTITDSGAGGTNTISLNMVMTAATTASVTNAGETLDITGLISGAYALTANGSGGTVVLTNGANSYSNGTKISSGGILQLGAANAVPSTGAVTVTGTWDLDGYADTVTSIAGAGTIEDSSATGATLTINGTTSTSFTGTIENDNGPVSLVDASTGTLTLSGTNTYTGTTTISGDGGILKLGAADALPSTSDVTVVSGATLNLAGDSDTIGSLAGAGEVENTTGTATLTTNGDNASTAFSGTLTQTGTKTLSLTKMGTGTLTLSGANTYKGDTTIDAGTLNISADDNLGTAPTSATPGSLTFDGGTLATTATFALTADRGITLTLTGAIDVAPGTTLTYGGIAAGSAGLSLVDSGMLVLSGANTYTGPTAIGAGTLQLGAANSVPNVSDVTVTGVFDLNGYADAIGSLAGTGTVEDSSATAVALTTNGDNSSTAFSGTIEDGNGALSLTKSGTGTLALSGTNAYSGSTTIDAGTLSISADDNLGTAPESATPRNLTFDGGTLAATSTFTLNGNRGIAFTSTGTIDVASGATLTYGGVAAGAGGLTMTDSGTLVLSGTNTYTGITTLDGGTLSISADDNLGTAPATATPGSLTFDGGALATTATFTLTADRGIAFTATGTISPSSATTLTYGGIAAGAGGLTTNGAGTLVLSGTNTYSGISTISAGTLTVNGSQSASAVSLDGGTLDGTGSVGAIASTPSGGTLDPGNGSPGILTSGGLDLSTGSPTFSVQLNGTTAGTGFNQLSTGGTIDLTGAQLSGSLGFTPSNGQVFTIIDNTGSNAVTGTFSGLSEGSTITLGGHTFSISYVGGTGHSVTLTMVAPSLALVDSVSPSATGQNPGTNLTYTIAFTNNGNQPAVNTTITTAIPNSTDFEVGSVASSLGTTGLSVSVAYSDDGGTTYTYTPVSGGGGAGTGYDRNVTNIQWTLTGSLSQTSPNNAGSVSFTARIR